MTALQRARHQGMPRPQANVYAEPEDNLTDTAYRLACLLVQVRELAEVAEQESRAGCVQADDAARTALRAAALQLDSAAAQVQIAQTRTARRATEADG